MRRLLILVVTAVVMMSAPEAQARQAATAASVQAKQDAVKLQLANRFIQVIQGDQMGEMMGQMTGMFLPSSLAGASEAEVAEYRETMTEISTRMMPRIFGVMAPIYAEIFTLEELQALVAFYESDLGRSMMEKNYAAAPRIAEAMQAAMPDIMSDMAVVICERMECSAEQLREMKSAIRAQIGG